MPKFNRPVEPGHSSPPLAPRHVQQLVAIAESVADDRASESEILRVAADLSESLENPRGLYLFAVAHRLCEFLRDVTDADVAFCRTVRDSRTLALVKSVVWKGGVAKAGEVPTIKYLDDGPCCLDLTSGGDRENCHYQSARQRGTYSSAELAFMDWLKSEAWVPIRINNATRAVIVLGKGKKGHFDGPRIDNLKQYEPFVRAFYRLADLREERAQKEELLKRVAAILPEFTAAKDVKAFSRAICTLLTCDYGFRFDRAMVFWMTNRGYPAECTMAVGGTGTDWPNRRKSVSTHFQSLSDYVRDSLKNPEPGTGPCPVRDPLWEEVRRSPLFFRKDDGGDVKRMIDNRRALEEAALKLSSRDDWVRKIQSSRPNIFCGPRRDRPRSDAPRARPGRSIRKHAERRRVR